jgi:transcriptional regulator of acetoin/glycerol metabolism
MPPSVCEEVLTLLTSYAWPGNVSQLEQLAARFVRDAAGGVIQVTDLPPEVLVAAQASHSAMSST